jgi:hypothetical protein
LAQKNSAIVESLNSIDIDIDIDIDSLLFETKAFMRKMHFVKEDFGLKPYKSHIGTCINYSDLVEMSDDFIKEMLASILRFVYSPEKQLQIKNELELEGRDKDSAFSMLLMRAKDKFRKCEVKGQFSELLIFNLLQHHFKAIPILRKMPITTNPAMERFGADAIHIGKTNNKLTLYIAECKTYDRKKDAFKNAFKDAVTDVIMHYREHRNELNLYIFEDFIPKELEQLVRDYISGQINNLEVQLVCMVSYRNELCINGSCKDDLLEGSISNIREQAKLINDQFFNTIPGNLIGRLNYILFPINDMDNLLNKFMRGLN